MSNLSKLDPVAANKERRRLATERNAASVTAQPAYTLDARTGELQRHDRLMSAKASMQALIVRLGTFESHIMNYPQSDNAWSAYLDVYSKIENYAREIARLSDGKVQIPAKLTRTEKPAPVVIENDPFAIPPDDDQPLWNRTPEARARHKAAIAAENGIAADLRFRKATGGA
jgi:hypothetical protein